MFYRNIILLISLLVFPISGSGVEPLNGLLMDRTTSMSGQEFFSQFSMEWARSPLSNSVNVLVTEEHALRSGSIIKILVDDRLVFQVPLTPRKGVEQGEVTAATKAVLEAALRVVSTPTR